MRYDYDAVVVGGGISGLTAAAYLCRHDIRTLLLEKTEGLGGLVNTFDRHGFKFDGGARAFENSGILFPMLKNLDIEMEFVSHPVMLAISDERVELRTVVDIDRYGAMLKAYFPENAADIDKIIAEIRKITGYLDVIYGIDNPLFRDDMKDPEYLKATLLPWFLQYAKSMWKIRKLKEPVYDYLGQFTDNVALIDMIAQHFFAGTPTFFALSYFGLYLDYAYPKQGTGALAEELARYIDANGGAIRTGKGVREVYARQHSLALTTGEYVNYKKLIWAADQRTFYSMLKGADTKPVERRAALVKDAAVADSVLTVFAGVNRPPESFADKLNPHTFYTPKTAGISSLPTPKDAADNAIDDWLDRYLERTTYEISCPALRNPKLAPRGKTGLILSRQQLEIPFS